MKRDLQSADDKLTQRVDELGAAIRGIINTYGIMDRDGYCRLCRKDIAGHGEGHADTCIITTLPEIKEKGGDDGKRLER